MKRTADEMLQNSNCTAAQSNRPAPKTISAQSIAAQTNGISVEIQISGGVEGRFYHKTSAFVNASPKEHALEYGFQKGHTFFVERQVPAKVPIKSSVVYKAASVYRSYGSFVDVDAFARFQAGLPEHERCFSECVGVIKDPETGLAAVRPFFDIEFTVPFEKKVTSVVESKAYLDRVIRRTMKAFKDDFGINLGPEDVAIAKGSRRIENEKEKEKKTGGAGTFSDLWKNSFHVHFPTVAFEDGSLLKEWMEVLLKPRLNEIPEKPEMLEKRGAIDYSVYGNGRIFRLVGNRKCGEVLGGQDGQGENENHRGQHDREENDGHHNLVSITPHHALSNFLVSVLPDQYRELLENSPNHCIDRKALDEAYKRNKIPLGPLGPEKQSNAKGKAGKTTKLQVPAQSELGIFALWASRPQEKGSENPNSMAPPKNKNF
jgi:hypothetical protein